MDLDSDGPDKGIGVFGFCAAEASCSLVMCLYVWCLTHNEGKSLVMSVRYPTLPAELSPLLISYF